MEIQIRYQLVLDNVYYIEEQVKIAEQLISHLNELYYVSEILSSERSSGIKQAIMKTEKLKRAFLKKKEILEDMVYSLKMYEYQASQEFEEIVIQVRYSMEDMYG